MNYSTIDDLKKLIDNQIEESTTLEYKSSFAMQKSSWRDELAKDVSAMANSNGGTIFYGIREKEGNNGHAIPDKLIPIENSEMSKDRLSQLLSSNIQPVIEGIEITYIPFDEHSGFYVVSVPKGRTAHQNRLTHIYYMRRNSTVEAMEDFAIRDIMNRIKTPIIDVEFTLVKKTIHVKTYNYTAVSFLGRSEENTQRTDYILKCRLVNNGEIYANYINSFIYIPKDVLATNDDYAEEGDYYRLYEDNTTRDLMRLNGMHKEYGPVRYDPLLPGMSVNCRSVKLDLDDIENLLPLKYKIHADNAPTRCVKVSWDQIYAEEDTDYEVNDPMAPPSIF